MKPIDVIINSVVNKVSTLEQKYVEKIVWEVLGIEIDPWGNIKFVNPSFAEKISALPNVVEAVTKLENRIAKSVCKQLPQTTINNLANNVKDMLLEHIEEKVYREVLLEIEEKISTDVKAKLTTNSKLAPYFKEQ
jgi:hypothetical protein